ncbi:hypothetical protein Tco_0481553 [Tanacetum coccineum]
MVVQNQAELSEDEVVHKELGYSLVRATRCQETIGDTIAQTGFENVYKHSNDSLLARGNTLQSDEDSLKLKELMELCTNLQQRVLDLEKTKTTQQNEIASLNRRVKKLEQKKRSRTHGLKRLHKVGMSRRVESSEDEEDLDDADNEIFDVDALTGDEVFVEQEVAAKDVNLTIDEVTLAQALAALKSVKPKVKGDVIKEPSVLVSAASVSTKVNAATTTTATIPTPRKGIVIIELGTPTITRSSQQPSQTKVQDKGKGKMVEPEPIKTMKKKDLIKLDKETAKRLQAEFDEEERLAREKDETNVSLIEEWDDIQAKIEADHELAQRLQAEEQEELSVEEKAKLFQQLLEQRRKHFAAKSAEEKRNKPPTQAQQRKIMCTYLKNMEGKKLKDLKNKSFDSIQKMFDRAFKRVNTFVDFRTDLVEGSSKRAGEELEQESTKKQKVDEDKDTTELQSLMEVIPDEEEVAIDAIPLATKPPTIVDWKIHKEGKKSYYQIVRADGKSQMYIVFSIILKSFRKEDLEDLYKLVKAKYESTRPVEDSDLVHSLRMQHVYIHMLVEKRYPLIPSTITDMLNKKLQGRIVGIKSLLNAVSITAALIDVNAAQSKLVLLENFNENYSKCLRLLYKVNVAEGVNAASEEVSTAELVSTAYKDDREQQTCSKLAKKLETNLQQNLKQTCSRPQQKNKKHKNVPLVAEKQLTQKNKTKITSQTTTEHEHRNKENLSHIFKLAKFSIRSIDDYNQDLLHNAVYQGLEPTFTRLKKKKKKHVGPSMMPDITFVMLEDMSPDNEEIGTIFAAKRSKVRSS